MAEKSENATAIEVDGISKRFGKLQAVDNVSFQVPAGEIFGLLGPNGAGKSTLIRMLTTLVPPTGGTAIVAVHDIIREPDAVRINIGVIPQNMTSDPELTCAENVGIHARLYCITGARRRKRTAELLEAVGLGDRANALASTLSGGMRRRLEIARGIVHDPKILFLDEPTTGLDPEVRADMWSEISRLAAERGKTVLLTTHYLEEADQLAERIAMASPPVSAYAADLGRGVPEHAARIDELISQFAEGWTLDRMPAVDRNVLRIGVYELLWAPDVPDGVAISEAVLLARDLSTDASPAFVNGLLARIAELKPSLQV